MLTDLENYLFDLRGYLVLEGALSAEEVTALNAGIDASAADQCGASGRAMFTGQTFERQTTASTCSRFTRAASRSKS